MDVSNGSYTEYVLTETVGELNLRYANTLIPLATLLGIFCVLGISGNIIVLCAFSLGREYKTTNFKVFVICIAVIDLLTCITLIPAEILKTRHYFSFSSPLPCKVKCFFNMFSMTSSALVLMVISLDRHRKICQPLKKQLTIRHATFCAVAMVIFSFVAAVPAPFICGLQETNMTNIHKTLTTVTVCSAEDRFLKNKQYVYKFGMSLLLLSVSLALIVMYTLIIKTIAHHWKRRTSTYTIRFEATLNRPKYSFNENVPTPIDGDVDKDTNDTTSSNTNVKRPCTLGHNLMSNRQHEQSQTNCKISFSTLALEQPPLDISHAKPDQYDKKVGHPSTTLSSRNRPPSKPSFGRQQSGSSTIGHQRLPYKSIIWIILTLIFLVTFFLCAGLSFLSTKTHTFEPPTLLWYLIFYRLHYINNIINPLVYALLDTRFKRSCKTLLFRAKRVFL